MDHSQQHDTINGKHEGGNYGRLLNDTDVVVGDSAIGKGKAEQVGVTTLKAVEDQTRVRAARANFPELLDCIEEAESRHAKAQVLAGAAPDRDPKRFESDRLADEHIEALLKTGSTQLAKSQRAHEKRHAAELALSGVQAPDLSVVVRVLPVIAVSMLVMLGAGFLLAPTLSDQMFGDFVQNIFGEGDTQYGPLILVGVGTALAGMVVLPQLAGTIFFRGALGRLKVLFIFGDIVLAGAVGGLRLTHGFQIAPLCWTLIELAGLLVHTGMVLVVASYLQKQESSRAIYVPLRGKVKTLKAECKRIDAMLARTQKQLSEQVRIIADREMSSHQAALHAELADSTARLTYLTETAHLISNAAQGQPDERMERHVAEHLDTEGKRLTRMPRAITRKPVTI